MHGGLANSIVIGEKFPVLTPAYSISEGRLALTGELDKSIGLHSDSKEESKDL